LGKGKKKEAEKTKKEAMNKRQRGRNETPRIGSWESEQWREVARLGGTTQKQTT